MRPQTYNYTGIYIKLLHSLFKLTEKGKERVLLAHTIFRTKVSIEKWCEKNNNISKFSFFGEWVNLKLKLLLECHSWPHWKKNDLRDFFLFCPKNNYFSGTTKKERRILVFNIFFAGFIFFAFFGVFLFIGSKSENI